MDESTAYTWTPPEFNLSSPPSSSESWPVFPDPGNFARSAKWCPDGSVALVQCEHREFRILTPKTSPPLNGIANPNLNPNTGTPPRVLPQSAPILDYAWYPTASSATPASFCFVASLRASYGIVDHRERQIAPHSLAFNLSGTKLYCGFEDAIEVFDVGRPGPGEGTRLHTSPSKKSRDGLKGEFYLHLNSCTADMYAAGSLTATPGNIVLFTETDGTVPVSFIAGGPSAGVTQLHFNPTRPHILYAAFRRQRDIYSWDLRADVNAPVTIYSPSSVPGEREEVEETNTNQKRRFDVDVMGRWLGIGDQEGAAHLFSLVSENDDGGQPVSPTLTWNAHKDAIGSVSFHPTHPTLLSVSGSRHFHTESESSSSDDSNEEGEKPNNERRRAIRRSIVRRGPVALDSSMKVWDLGGP
ncbi:Telomerase Cajal body protein 1 [Mycena sanguinolenta]|uniref:Telomerase Cajal body protein 1 n=1 Tax=Mycena sanguinolenta TaxID=230812 RepID=A0A8H7DJX6_9AGAR|nr:Telomerase Cajal body protein 1 [Mycena sanguinolenta]